MMVGKTRDEIVRGMTRQERDEAVQRLYLESCKRPAGVQWDVVLWTVLALAAFGRLIFGGY